MQGGSLPSRRRQPTPSNGLPISPGLNGNRNKAVLFSTSTSAVVQAVPSSLFSIIIIIELIKYFFFLPLPPICGHCQCCTALRWYPVTPTKLPERLGVPRGGQGSKSFTHIVTCTVHKVPQLGTSIGGVTVLGGGHILSTPARFRPTPCCMGNTLGYNTCITATQHGALRRLRLRQACRHSESKCIWVHHGHGVQYPVRDGI